jgi:hypothetical protein
MTPDSGQPTNSELKATLSGLDRYLKSEFGNLHNQLDYLKDLPLKVERISTRLESVEVRVKDMEDEKLNSGNKIIQWVSIITVLLIGIGSIVINLIQVSHG